LGNGEIMAIELQYGPSAAVVGMAAYSAGQGKYRREQQQAYLPIFRDQMAYRQQQALEQQRLRQQYQLALQHMGFEQGMQPQRLGVEGGLQAQRLTAEGLRHHETIEGENQRNRDRITAYPPKPAAPIPSQYGAGLPIPDSPAQPQQLPQQIQQPSGQQQPSGVGAALYQYQNAEKAFLNPNMGYTYEGAMLPGDARQPLSASGLVGMTLKSPQDRVRQRAQQEADERRRRLGILSPYSFSGPQTTISPYGGQ
jgi:hypothetical protein